MALVSLFVDQQGHTLSRQMLAKRLGEEAEVFDPRRLEILIRRLRNKVEQATEDELPLTTVYGLGFNFTQPLRKQ
jgi:DNA-binding response OmpR family regulator